MSSKKDLMLICADMWDEIVRLLRKDALVHIIILKQKALNTVVRNEDLKKSIRERLYCPACFIARENCKKCLMLDVWGYKEGDTGVSDYLCSRPNSPYTIVADINNGTSRLSSAQKIADEARRIANIL